MNIIVFGGSGFLGSYVADALSDAGHKVIIYDWKRSEYLKPDQEMIVGDILDEQQISKAIKGVDIVFNFAGIADINEASCKPVETVKYNILGNTIILDAARTNKVKRFVFASTIYVYGDSGSFYRCSKNACELYVESYQKKFGLDYTILRYGTIYGCRADMRNSVYRYIYQALTEGKITYYGDGTEIREYINVVDAAKNSVKILSDEFRNQNIIFTGHHPMKVSELFTMIKEILNKDIILEYKEPESEDPENHYAITPYKFIPKMGRKLVSHCYTDMGQGILLCMQEIHNNIHQSTENRN